MIEELVDVYLTQKYEALASSLSNTPVKFNSPGSDIRKVYQIGRRIDTGNRSTYGQVRVCTHVKLQVRRAVKTYCFFEAQLHGETLVIPSMPGFNLNAVLVEIESLARIDSQYVVECFEIFYDRGFFHIILELCKGGDLHDLLRKQKLPERQALTYFSQMLLGLIKIHQSGFAHRALCLENVLMLDSDHSKLKIISFASAGNITPAGFSSKFGSPLYMAPEIFEGTYTETVDVWALGVILYTLVFGFQPFYSTELQPLITLITSLNYSKPARWKHLTLATTDLLEITLKKPRPTPEEIYNQPIFKFLMEQESRITQRRATRVSLDISTEPESSIKMMAGARLKVAVLNFISQNKATSERHDDLKMLLEQTVKSEDQMISEAELAMTLAEFYTRIGVRIDTALKARNIVALLDTSHTGYVNIESILDHFNHDASSESSLRAAFEGFAPDLSVVASLDELKELFRSMENSQLSQKIEERLANSKDRGITFEEFIVLLQN